MREKAGKTDDAYVCTIAKGKGKEWNEGPEMRATRNADGKVRYDARQALYVLPCPVRCVVSQNAPRIGDVGQVAEYIDHDGTGHAPVQVAQRNEQHVVVPHDHGDDLRAGEHIKGARDAVDKGDEAQQISSKWVELGEDLQDVSDEGREKGRGARLVDPGGHEAVEFGGDIAGGDGGRADLDNKDPETHC